MSRPSDYIDGNAPEAAEIATAPIADEGAVLAGRLGPVGWLRFAWRQLTSMRTALMLLLLLAIAAVPGSLVPQRSSDPNGVRQYFVNNPQLAPVLDSLGVFEVYSSAWFSAIYLLLFTSLIGCVIPRLRHHLRALRAAPPTTPARLERLAGTVELRVNATPEQILASAERWLRSARYRTVRYPVAGGSISAERGYLRETGNLLFHGALVAVLIAVAIGGGFGYTGQRVVVTGQSFVNTLASYDSFNPGRWFNPNALPPYALSLDHFAVSYETENKKALGQPVDFTATVGILSPDGRRQSQVIKVNDPLRLAGTSVYLLGNGYAPTITVRDPRGRIVFRDAVPFLPQDAKLTSVGVVKVPDGLTEQLGMVGFFYPTQTKLSNGAFSSAFPDLEFPMLTLNVYAGDLGINDGTPRSVYALDTSRLRQLNGGKTGVKSIELLPGQSAQLPAGLGTVSFDDARGSAATTKSYTDSVLRFVSLEVHSDPAEGWVLASVLVAVAGLVGSMFVSRRRLWVKVLQNRAGVRRVQVAGLARGDDARLEEAITQLALALEREHGAEGPRGDALK